VGWRRNRKKQREKNKRGGQQPDLVGRRPKRGPYRESIARYKQADAERPGPLAAERAARIAAQANKRPQDAQGGPGTPQTTPGQPEATKQTAAQGPTPVATPTEGVQGEHGNVQRDTALFESRGGIRGDAELVRKAVRKRWETDHRMAEAILTKVGLKALQDDTLSMPQLIGAGKLMLDVERQNQTEEHHAERMDYAERALAHRVATTGGPIPAMGVGVGVRLGDRDSGAEVAIQVYVPDNGREARPEPIVDEIIANP
jgi:hypothetical protein